MDKNERFFTNDHNRSPQPHDLPFSPQNLLVVYTVFSILIRMKEKLGFEAMWEYMFHYWQIVGRKNPSIRAAVIRAQEAMDVERMYYDALSSKE